MLLLLGAAAFFFVVPPLVERRMNVTFASPPYAVSPPARALHPQLFVADMHADSLLWGRDLLSRATRGHVDLPRLREGGVALQAFTVVTKTPRGLNIESNDDRSDNITLLAIASRWPVATWGSLKARALYQAACLRDTAARSGGQLTLIRTAADLADFQARRQRDASLVGAWLGLEGAHALEGDVRHLDELFDAGFRMIAPTHFFDTEFGGAASGLRKGGLTVLGRELVRRMEEKGMILDLAHASAQTIADATAMARRPVVASHTGIKGTCNNNRNLDDEQLRAVARTGGIIGIGYWETAICGRDARSIARAIKYAAGVIGVEHVALGSDFDGAVAQPFDVTGTPQITDALLDEGFTDEQIKLIMGGNVVRVLAETLPR